MMTKTTLTVAACATLLWTGAALAIPTHQENCDKARVTAWKTYVSCVDTVVAKDASCAPTLACLVSFDKSAAFAKCRHTYFRQWTLFQLKKLLATSTCIGTRYTDNLDQTVTDNLNGLVWEKKDNLGGIHDKDNFYVWSTGTNKENGTAFTTFLSTVNGAGGFAGANGWRLPTLAELQTIVLDFPCTKAGCSCPSSPCVDLALDPGNTQSFGYWSATGYVPLPGFVWFVTFSGGGVGADDETSDGYVRAVRGGW